MRRTMAQHRSLAAVLVAVCGLATARSEAAGLLIQARDARGRAVSDAAIGLYPLGVSPTPTGPEGTAIIDQIDEEFVPHVSVVRVGTRVSFPNHDEIRHHVYSFSPAKTFELPLYKGVSAEPVQFDHAGTVVLGCNIHDWMTAYVYVLDTPYLAKTAEDGSARFADMPPGKYRVVLQHPRARTEPEPQEIVLGAEEPAALTFTLELRPALRRSRPPRPGDRGYR